MRILFLQKRLQFSLNYLKRQSLKNINVVEMMFRYLYRNETKEESFSSRRITSNKKCFQNISRKDLDRMKLLFFVYFIRKKWEDFPQERSFDWRGIFIDKFARKSNHWKRCLFTYRWWWVENRFSYFFIRDSIPWNFCHS